MNRFTIVAAVLGLSGSCVALAQDPDGLPDRPISRAEVLAVVKVQFDAADTNHDGAVSRAEFDAYRRRLTAAHEETPSGIAGLGRIGGKWFDRADANDDGKVTLAEADARPMELFDLADTNHDGVVSPQELQLARLFMGAR